MSRVWDEPIRDRSNVINLRPRINPGHPSLQPPAMYDQTKAPADRTVVLTVIEAALNRTEGDG